jgi:Spy/CpxP family protein refolding chaperone
MKRCLISAVVLLLSSVAMAQPPDFGGPGGPPPGQGGFGGQGGPGRGQGRPGQGGFGGQMGMPRVVSAASVSLRALVAYLTLSDGQIGKIALIREDMMEAMRPAPPKRPTDGQPPQQPRREDMQAKSLAAEKKATAEINALLSDGQRKQLGILVKAMKALQAGGIRPDAVIKLALTNDQLDKLAAGNVVDNVLTDEQQTIAEGYRMPPGGPGFGGPGGPGGFPGGPGGPGGFPGGPGGPPPGQGGFGPPPQFGDPGQGGPGGPPPPGEA